MRITFRRWLRVALTLVLLLGLGPQAQAIPKITSFAPKKGLAGTQVEILGIELGAASRVYFNGVEAPFSANILAGSVQAVVPAGAVTGRILVFTSAGFAVSSEDFVVGQPGTEIVSFTPQAPIGGEVVLVLSLAVPVIGVDFSGAKAQFTTISDTILLTRVPAGASSGLITVTFEGSSATSADRFIVKQGPVQSLPVIAGFSPVQGSVGRQVLIAGDNLTESILAVHFGAVSTDFAVTPEGLLATVPSRFQTGRLTVVTLQGRAFSPEPFVVLKTPEILSFEPQSGMADTEIEIFGHQIADAVETSFNGVPAPFRVKQTSGSLIARVPFEATTGRVSVRTPSGTAVSRDDFTLIEPKVRVTNFTPRGKAGSNVILVLDSIVPVTRVTFFEGLEASFSQITIGLKSLVLTHAPEAASSGRISVFFQGGRTVTRDPFTVIENAPTILPSISGFSPTQGAVGSQVLITGANLTNEILAIQFGGIAASFFQTPGGLVATVPTGARSGFISVITLQEIAVSGTPFSLGPHKVRWDRELSLAWDTPKNQVKQLIGGYRLYLSNSEGRLFSITDIPPDVTAATLDLRSVLTTNGTYTVYVTAFNNLESDPSQAVLFELSPTIGFLSARNGYAEDRVLISGAGFVDISAVRFNGVQANHSVLSSSQIEAKVPLTASSGDIEVVTAGGAVVTAGEFRIDPSYDLELTAASRLGVFANGIELPYSTHVNNRGPINATNVIFELNLPIGIETISFLANGVEVAPIGPAFRWNLGTLPSRTSANLKANLKLLQPGDHQIKGSVRAEHTDRILANNSISTSLTVLEPPQIAVRRLSEEVEISWIDDRREFSLEWISANSLATGQWSTVPASVEPDIGYFKVVVPTRDDARLFRLRAGGH